MLPGDPLSVDCPEPGCLAEVGRACWTEYAIRRDPHPSRWALVRPASTEVEALGDDLPPLALADLRSLSAYGAAKHGATPATSAAKWRPGDHVDKAHRHLDQAARMGAVCDTRIPGGRSIGSRLVDHGARDEETGVLHLLHAALRLMLEAEGLLEDERRKVGG